MDNFEKIEQLVSKTGCSYEDAKTALEGCGWNMIDAVVRLEKEGKLLKQSAAQKTADSGERIPEAAPSDLGADSSRTESRGEKAAAGNAAGGEGKAKREFKLWKRVKGIMLNNRMVMLRSNGQQVMDVPIVAPVIALIIFFWATLALAVVAMVFGFRFHFEGEDLGKTNINSTMDKATDYAEKVRNDLAGKANDKQDTDR